MDRIEICAAFRAFTGQDLEDLDSFRMLHVFGHHVELLSLAGLRPPSRHLADPYDGPDVLALAPLSVADDRKFSVELRLDLHQVAAVRVIRAILIRCIVLAHNRAFVSSLEEPPSELMDSGNGCRVANGQGKVVGAPDLLLY